MTKRFSTRWASPLVRASNDITLTCSAAEAWRVLEQFTTMSAWVPIVQHSSAFNDRNSGVGASRRVQLAAQTLVETVTIWEPHRQLTYSIEGLPSLIGEVHNEWLLTDSTEGTTVVLTTRMRPGRNPVKRFVAKKVLERMETASTFMLTSLKSASEHLDGVES